MDSVKAWAISICMASLAGTLAHFLSPSGNIQRIFKVVISVFFITVMIYPIVGLTTDDIGDVIDGYTYADSYADNVDDIADVVLKQSVAQIKSGVRDVLRTLEIDEAEITVNTDIADDDSIVISSVEITVGEEYRSEIHQIKTELSKNIDCQINVYVGGNGNG